MKSSGAQETDNMGSGNEINRKIEDLINMARGGWASGELASASDFDFVEDAWINFHLDQPISRRQVRRLEEIVLSLKSKVSCM